ncbi:MAG: MBL fold metallo-hydrolase [Georgenia sp.]
MSIDGHAVAGGRWSGGRVSDRATCVLAPNGGPMTLEGTNTWVLREPGAAEAVVVDPGPLDEEHLGRVRTVAERDGGRITLIVLTHHHRDHAEATHRLGALTGAPVRGAGNDQPADGEVLTAGGLRVGVLAAPGHTADSLCLLLPAEGLLLTGDTLLGRGSTIIAWPDGDLGNYLTTLERLAGLADDRGVRLVAPGHGPLVPDPVTALHTLLRHRHERLDQVRTLLAAGVSGVDDMLSAVYGPTDGMREFAARKTVEAQLAYLGASPA